jgi:hypothetical protein
MKWVTGFNLFLRDCPYAYNVHCMAHKLQLALVAASREAKHIHQFFIQLASIINIVGGSSKRHDELQSAQAVEIESLIISNKLKLERVQTKLVLCNDLEILDGHLIINLFTV